MPKARSGHVIIGLGLAVMGYAVLVIAFSRQAERVRTSTAQAGGGAAAALAPIGASPVVAGNGGWTPSPSAVALADPRAGDGGDPLRSPAEGGVADAASDVDELVDGADAVNVRVFRFYSGGAAMSREELQRLSVLGRAVARHPTAQLTLEAFGDTPGTDALNVGIAKHRLRVAENLLVRAGLTEERLTLLTGDVASDSRLARSLRVSSTPPLREVEKP